MYYFYIGGIQLPVTPSKLTMKIKNQNKTLSLINEGEISFLKSPGLTEISFDATFPYTNYPYASYPNGFRQPEEYLSLLRQYKVDRKPFQFIVSRMSPSGKLLFSTDIAVSLEDYKITEDAKNGSEVVVSIKLKEYREYKTEVIRG